MKSHYFYSMLLFNFISIIFDISVKTKSQKVIYFLEIDSFISCTEIIFETNSLHIIRISIS